MYMRYEIMNWLFLHSVKKFFHYKLSRRVADGGRFYNENRC